MNLLVYIAYYRARLETLGLVRYSNFNIRLP